MSVGAWPTTIGSPSPVTAKSLNVFVPMAPNRKESIRTVGSITTGSAGSCRPRTKPYAVDPSRAAGSTWNSTGTDARRPSRSCHATGRECSTVSDAVATASVPADVRATLCAPRTRNRAPPTSAPGWTTSEYSMAPGRAANRRSIPVHGSS